MASQANLRVRVLGALAVAVDGREVPAHRLASRKGRTLLKLLLARRGAVVPADVLVEALWEGRPPADPDANLATLVSRLRAVLGPDTIAGDRQGWRFVAGTVAEVDLDEAERLAGEAEARLGGQPALALAAAERALDLLGRGAFLADDPDADWALPARRARLAVGHARPRRRRRARRRPGRLRAAPPDPGRRARHRPRPRDQLPPPRHPPRGGRTERGHPRGRADGRPGWGRRGSGRPGWRRRRPSWPGRPAAAAADRRRPPPGGRVHPGAAPLPAAPPGRRPPAGPGHGAGRGGRRGARRPGRRRPGPGAGPAAGRRRGRAGPPLRRGRPGRPGAGAGPGPHPVHGREPAGRGRGRSRREHRPGVAARRGGDPGPPGRPRGRDPAAGGGGGRRRLRPGGRRRPARPAGRGRRLLGPSGPWPPACWPRTTPAPGTGSPTTWSARSSTRPARGRPGSPATADRPRSSPTGPRRPPATPPPPATGPPRPRPGGRRPPEPPGPTPTATPSACSTRPWPRPPGPATRRWRRAPCWTGAGSCPPSATTLACANLGDLRGALDRLALLERLLAEVEDRFYHARASTTGSWLWRELGDLGRARALAERSVDLLGPAATGTHPGLHAQLSLAETALVGGDHTGAAALDRMAAALPRA